MGLIAGLPWRLRLLARERERSASEECLLGVPYGECERGFAWLPAEMGIGIAAAAGGSGESEGCDVGPEGMGGKDMLFERSEVGVLSSMAEVLGRCAVRDWRVDI